LEEVERERDEAGATADGLGRRIEELEAERERLLAVAAAQAELGDRLGALERERDEAYRRVAEAEDAARRSEDLARELKGRCAELEEAVAEAETRQAATTPEATRHLLFVQSGARYDLLERDGPPPARGEEVELHDVRFVVTKLGRSPLARDTRPCAYLYAAA
jgi:chromosome segregation ATPase